MYWNRPENIHAHYTPCNSAGDRKYCWASIGVSQVKYRPFQRSERWSILPAYTVDGFITWKVVHGSFTPQMFEEWIENELLPLCSPYPHPRSVICMNNAPIHQSVVHNTILKITDVSAWWNCVKTRVYDLNSFHHTHPISTRLRKHLQS